MGVKKQANIVEIIVSEIERGTSAPIRNATKFEAVPPGQEPKIINPRVSSSSKLNNFDKVTAKIGITEN